MCARASASPHKTYNNHYFFSTEAYAGLSPKTVLTMSDRMAEAMLAAARWGGDGSTQVCPSCGMAGKHYWLRTRRQYTCRAQECQHRFSVTSRTPLAYHKLSLQEIIYYLVQQAAAVKGKSALELSRGMAICVSTAYVLGMKLRQALHAYQTALMLDGEVEMDGVYFNTYTRPSQRKSDAVDGRTKEHNNPNKRCVFVMRQRGTGERSGAVKTIAVVMQSENEDDIRTAVQRHVAPGATVITDQNSAYNALHAYYEVRSVNHKEEFSTADGINQNQAESYNARLRRLVQGQIHRAASHFGLYASEIAFREDVRRLAKTTIVFTMLQCLLKPPPSQFFVRYGHKGKKASIAVAGEAQAMPLAA